MTQSSKRDELIERAKYGEMSGEEADAEAIRLGLGCLSRRPGPDEFRPEAMNHWTLPMVLAWIAYLDLDEVREWSAPYVEECRHWMWRRWQIGFDGPIHEGWFLEQRAKPTVALLGIRAAIDEADESKTMSVTIREAQESLWIMLRDGFLTATGIDTVTGRRVEIPSVEWHDLKPVELHGKVDELHRGGLRHGAAYSDVLFPSAIVQRYWRSKGVPTYSLPDLLPPVGHGYMPLFCAAQWIATKGGKHNFDPSDVEVWRLAFGELLSGIASEAIRVVGVSQSHTQPVPAYLFAGIRVDYPFADSDIDLILSDELVLRSYPYLGESDWHKGSSDALADRRGDHWSRLMVEKSDVRAQWPFDEPPPSGTGLPGRPSKSKHLIEDEFRRRAAAGALADSLPVEATELLAWLTATHPTSPRPTVGVVKNNIRADYNRLKRTK